MMASLVYTFIGVSTQIYFITLTVFLGKLMMASLVYTFIGVSTQIYFITLTVFLELYQTP